MFEGFKIKRIISQIISLPGQDNTPLVRSLREYGKDGLKELVDNFRMNKILGADFQRYIHAWYVREHLDFFIDYLGDGKETIREIMKECIEQKSGPSAVPRLVERLREPNSQLRRGIAESLRKLGSPAIIDKIIPMLNEDDKDLKGVVMGLVGDLGGAQAAVYLLPLLRSTDWWVRKKAVEAICKIKDPKSVDPLIELLAAEKDPKIKMMVIQTLGQIGNASAARAILPSIADNDLIVRQMVVEALENIADKEMVPEIINAMRGAEVNVRRAGVEILSKLKDAQAAETLLRCIQDTDWWVREIATDALAIVKDGSVAKKVIGLFKNPDENIRRAAVEYFNRVPDKEAFGPLIEVLKDADWWVREKAVMALGKLKDPSAIDHIIQLKDDYDVRWVVPQALAEIGGPRVLDYLADFMDDPERNVRMEALKALGRLNDKSVLPIIKATVKDSDSEIRDTALAIIKEMTGHAVKANQIIAEQEREKWTGGSTIFTSPFMGGGSVMREAILVLDLANSTDIGSKYGDDVAFRLTNRLVEETRPLSAKHRVRFTKSTGDGFLMTFNEVANAVQFAKDILATIRAGNAKFPAHERIDVRIAINCGETRIDDKGDRLGTAVNKTFRVEGVKAANLIPVETGMKPEEMPLLNRILITDEVRLELEKTGETQTRVVGLFELKGIAGKHKIHQVITES